MGVFFHSYCFHFDYSSIPFSYSLSRILLPSVLPLHEQQQQKKKKYRISIHTIHVYPDYETYDSIQTATTKQSTTITTMGQKKEKKIIEENKEHTTK